MRILVALLVLVAGLAGCTGAETEDPAQASSESTDPAQETANDPVTGAAAPTAALLVDVTNGTAPVTVNVTVTAQGNATAWILDLGDGNQTEGTAFPATLNHTYGVGNFTLNLTVTGPGGNSSDAHVVQVVAAEAPAAQPLVLQPFSETVSVDLPCVGCGDGGTLTCTWRQTGQASAQDCAWIDFPDELAGQPFTLTGTGLDQDVLFWEECDAGVSDKFNGLNDGEAGIVPAGAGCALVWEQFDFLVDLTFTISPV